MTLLQRLRNTHPHDSRDSGYAETASEAADEIERLRAQLATACAEQIRLSLENLTLQAERDEARALGRIA